MKIALFGENSKILKPTLIQVGLKEANPNKADIIISFGGDGTFLAAERKFPGTPKLMIREKRFCARCLSESYLKTLKNLKAKKYKIIKLIKLEARYNKTKINGFNDIIVHNAIPTQAIRYQVFVNKALYADEVIGDGIVVATPFGSGGYYRSITDSTFLTGIGFAFNNSTRQLDHVVLPEDSVIKIKILRGPAVLAADNLRKMIKIRNGGEVKIKKAKVFAQVFDHPTLFCDECRRGRTIQTAVFPPHNH